MNTKHLNTKSNLAASLCAGIAMGALLLNSANAQDLPAKLGNVSIVSLDRMSLTNNGSDYLVAVDITFQNLNAEPLRFRNADLDVTLQTVRPNGTNELVNLGLSHIGAVALPSGSTNAPGTVSTTANIMVGPASDATNMKLVQLFNAVGDPGNKVSLLLKGASALDLKLPNGWVGETDKRFEVDLTFKPTLQRNVLLN
jgi:hypothetical protein